MPEKASDTTPKWAHAAWKTESDGFITKAKATLLAREIGQRLGVYYFETFNHESGACNCA